MNGISSNQRIKELIDNLGISQTEFCNRTKITKSALSNYLNGDREPRQPQLKKIADSFGVSPTWLMGYDVPMYARIPGPDDLPSESYYLNDEARDLAEFLYRNPDYKVLFDASRKVKPQDIEFVKEMIERLGGTDG